MFINEKTVTIYDELQKFSQHVNAVFLDSDFIRYSEKSLSGFTLSLKIKVKFKRPEWKYIEQQGRATTNYSCNAIDNL